MAKIIIKLFLTILLASFLVSCDLFDLKDTSGEPFYAHNFKTDSPYTIRAKILTEGEHCVIWAENGSGITKEKAKEIAAEYDNNIRHKIVDAFGMKNFTVDGEKFDDILDYANALADKKNKKLTILLLDIKDNFNLETNQSYVAGYFYSGNFFSKNQLPSSNECDMIYVDTYPSLDSKLVKPEQTFTTFAHELQHLINFATTTLNRKNIDNNGNVTSYNYMDTWIDEGLSSQAEHIYLGKHLEERCKQFSDDKKGTIAKGNNFFVWDNHPEEPMAILDDYSTVYLFFRWLYSQAEFKGLQTNFFLNIVTSDSYDYKIITNVANVLRPGNWNKWENLLNSWFTANYYPDNNDYGYKDSYFYTGNTKIKVNLIKTTDKTILLAPGEGVYSRINGSFTTPPSSGNIRYTGLDNGTSKALLTYNVNTNNKKTVAPETGTLTGVAASVSDAQTAGSRAAADDAQTETRPYAIDARDYNPTGILGRNK